MAITLGSNTPTRSPGSVSAAIALPSANEPVISLRKPTGLRSTSSRTLWAPPVISLASSSESNRVRRKSLLSNIISVISLDSCCPAQARRLRLRSSGGMLSRCGGRKVTRIFGNQRILTLPESRENGLYWAPSRRTGTSGASALSATMPGPSKIFISAPVTVMRPSGKITRVSPPLTTLIRVRVDSGLVGSIGNGARQRQEETHKAVLGDIGIDREDHVPRRERGDQGGVEKRLMIGDHHRALAGLLQILQTGDLDPIEHLQQPGDKALGQRAGQQPGDVDRHRQVDQADRQEHLRDAQAQGQQQRGGDGRDHHEQRVDDVVGGDIAGAVRVLAALLEQCVQRHDIDATGGGDQADVDQDAPTGKLVQKDRQAGRPARQSVAAGEIQVDDEHRHAQGTQGHEGRVDLALEHAVAQQRTERHANGEGHQKQGRQVLVAAQHVLGEGCDLGQERRTDQPEPGDRQDGQEDIAALGGITQHLPGRGERVVVHLQIRRRRAGGRDEARRHPADHRNGEDRRRDQVNAPIVQDQLAGHGAQQDRDEGPRLHPGVTGDQLVATQLLRQDAVLDRAEVGGLGPHQKQHRQQKPDVTQHEAQARDRHDRDLGELEDADQPGLVVLVRDLPGAGGEQKEREDEHPRRRGHHQRGVDARLLCHRKGDQKDDGVLEDIVVERPQGLGNEQRQETTAIEQLELVGSHRRQYLAVSIGGGWRLRNNTLDFLRGRILCI